jgi:hypothetical protein
LEDLEAFETCENGVGLVSIRVFLQVFEAYYNPYTISQALEHFHKSERLFKSL